jgi:hypothetical protein
MTQATGPKIWQQTIPKIPSTRMMVALELRGADIPGSGAELLNAGGGGTYEDIGFLLLSLAGPRAGQPQSDPILTYLHRKFS